MNKAALLLVALTAIGCGSSASTIGDAAAPDGAASPSSDPDAAVLISGAKVFDFGKLHRVELTIAPSDFATLNIEGSDIRVPCDIKYDDMQVVNAGVKLKGLGTWDSLDGKPSFSIKVNQFTAGAKLDGLSKLLLNNGRQDPTFLNEHIGYAAHRAMQVPAPLSSYAWVSVNGKSYGLYIVREAIAKGFLARNFGSTDTDGNLYEGYWHSDRPDDLTLGDFAVHPEELTINSNSVNRDDVIAFKTAIASATDATFVSALTPFIDLGQFQTQFAIEGLLGSQDSLPYFTNNYYLYHRANGKFVILPSGMDRLRLEEINWETTSVLPTRILAHPTLGPAQAAERVRLRQMMPWQDLIGLVTDADSTLHSHMFTDARLLEDIAAFDVSKATVKAKLQAYQQ
jgi:spore coat protein H